MEERATTGATITGAGWTSSCLKCDVGCSEHSEIEPVAE